MLFADIADTAPLFADVILPLNLPQTLTYGVPIDLHKLVQPGMRVEVSLGRNKQYAGIIYRLHYEKPENYEVKPIRNIIDESPIITPRQLRFWSWISSYYMAAPGEVMHAALPAHLKMSGETTIVWSGAPRMPFWTEDTHLVADALELKKELTMGDLRTLVGAKKVSLVIQELLESEAVWIQDNLEPAYRPKKEKMVSLGDDYHEEERLAALFQELDRAPKQLQVLLAFMDLSQKQRTIRQQDLLDRANVQSSVLKAMVDKGIFDISEQKTDRLFYPEKTEHPADIKLTDAQAAAMQQLDDQLAKHAVVLLEGVTGSGKTLIYIQKIQECLAQGKQVLMLLPEIGLTTQLVGRLYAFFGGELGVYHSRFSNNERVEIWEKVRSHQFKVVAGPRSALWLPFDDLGLIIVDEEHDSSYKQREPAPRFHARDAAVYISALYQAKVILGSATPSAESLFNVSQKKYGYVQLSERYKGLSLPAIEFVDAKTNEIFKAKNPRLITPQLHQAIEQTLAQGKQVILFQNRRGYAPFQLCVVCGWVPQCQNCAVSLTYHKSQDMLLCHYCGSKSAVMHTCHACGSNRLQSKSFGTERIEEEVHHLFPEARVARMDVDSMRARQSLPQLLDDLEHGRVDILVGTQMVVKGLDFAQVALVGILNADGLLSYPDFRVNERAFQLMEQVSGRAGRADGAGRVFIQGYNLKHPVLGWVQSHDVRAFFDHEIRYRQFFGYPPYSRLIKVCFKHEEEARAIQAATAFADAIKSIMELLVQGPVAALVPRVRGQYVQEVWLKLPKDGGLMQRVKQEAWMHRQRIGAQKGNGKLHILFDVDPA